MRIGGSVCLVTGAAGGIGAAAARALAAAGGVVLASDRTGDSLVADLAEPGAAARLAAAAEAIHGRVDVLVNCAGVGAYGPFSQLPVGDVERLLRVDLLAPVELTRALLPGMLARGAGHVVDVGSLVGHVGRPNEAVYASAKAGLGIFTESLRAELRGSGVGVSLVAPAAVATGFFAERGAPYGRRIPRPVPPERIARAIVRAVEDDLPEVLVPRWLRLPVALHGVAPRLFRSLASRFD